MFAARRDGVGRLGRLRAGTVLIVRGEFSLVIIGLVGASVEAVESVATAYVFVLALAGPLLTRFVGARAAPPTRMPVSRGPGPYAA
jgi:CPA2 family monovalent cation:H+ antiporter-2